MKAALIANGLDACPRNICRQSKLGVTHTPRVCWEFGTLGHSQPISSQSIHPSITYGPRSWGSKPAADWTDWSIIFFYYLLQMLNMTAERGWTDMNWCDFLGTNIVYTSAHFLVEERSSWKCQKIKHFRSAWHPEATTSDAQSGCKVHEVVMLNIVQHSHMPTGFWWLRSHVGLSKVNVHIGRFGLLARSAFWSNVQKKKKSSGWQLVCKYDFGKKARGRQGSRKKVSWTFKSETQRYSRKINVSERQR